MVIKIKKTKKAAKLRGTNSHGGGARGKRRGSGHRGGVGMAGTGKRADHKKTLITKLYGNKYFGKQGVTSRGTKRRKLKAINLKEIGLRFKGKTEINLKDHKILGGGEVKEKLIINALACTKSAKEKVEKAGGKIIVPVFKPKEKPKSSQKQSDVKKNLDDEKQANSDK